MTERTRDDPYLSGALPEPPDGTRFDGLPWKPLEDAPEGWEVAHRGGGRYLLRDSDGSLVNGPDHLWTLEECRAEIEVEEVLEARTEGEGTSPLERLHGIRREWLGWSVDRMETEANDVLDLEEPVPLEELSRDQVVQLIARWEPIHEREN